MRGLKKIIILAAVFAMASSLIFVRRTLDSRSGDQAYAVSAPLCNGSVVRQTFFMTESYLTSISFAVTYDQSMAAEGNLIFSLYDGEERLVYTETIPLAGLSVGTYWCVDIDKWVKKGEVYGWTLQMDGNYENAPSVVYSADPSMYVKENRELTQDGSPIAGEALNWYAFKEPLDTKNLIYTWLFILIVSFTLIEMTDSLQNRKTGR